MIRKLLPTLVIAALGPLQTGPVQAAPFMVFDARRIPSVGEMIVKDAASQEVPPHLVLAIVWRESKFQTGARHVERDGSVSYGLFQLNSRWHPNAAQMTVEENIHAGVSYVAAQIKRCGTDAGPVVRFAYTTGQCPKERGELCRGCAMRQVHRYTAQAAIR